MHVGGVDVGGMSRTEATAALQAKADEITGQRAYFDGFDQHWAPTLADLGVTADIDASIDQAMAIGREDSSRDRLSSAISSLSGDHNLPLQLAIDPATLDQWSESVDDQINLIPHDASLQVANGKIEITQEANGTIVDQSVLQSTLLESLQTMQAPTDPLPTIDKLPSVHAADLQPAQAAITAALEQPSHRDLRIPKLDDRSHPISGNTSRPASTPRKPAPMPFRYRSIRTVSQAGSRINSAKAWIPIP